MMRTRTRAESRAEDSAGSGKRFPRLIVFTGVMLLIYVIGLLVTDQSAGGVVEESLGIVTELLAVTVCVRAALRTRFRQWQILFGAAAVITYTVGDVLYLLELNGQQALTGMVGADIAYLAFYPFMLGALVVMMRKLKGLAWPLLLDSVVGALASGSLMALILTPVLTGTGGVAGLELVIVVLYPILNLLLITAVGGLLASWGLDLGPRWQLLVLGLVAFSVADIVFALTLEYYVIGSILDAAWVAGIVGITAWVDGAGRPAQESRGQIYERPAFLALMISTATALVVLLIGCRTPIPLLAQLLAAATLAMAAVPLVFRNRILSTLATTDELTGLPNRRALLVQVPPRLTRGRPGALFLLDLDCFKDINDALGHDVGDQLLIRVGQRFAEQLTSGDLLVRLGGDEFAVFLEGRDKDGAVEVARRLRGALEEPITIGLASLQVDVSIGVALTPANGTDLNLLMRKADVAMFRAKSDRSGHHLYSSLDDDGAARKLQTLQELRTAMAEGQLEMHYQPKVCLSDQEVTGTTSFEALVRWNHPVLGQLSPQKFLPLAEEARLMPKLTTLVLERTIEQVSSWRAEGLDVNVAVNLSGSCIPAYLPEQIRALLQQHHVPATSLTLEITEDTLMSAPRRTAEVLTQLRADGIRIAIDDFGTGYSSLAYLRDLPVDELKLDRSFITAMPEDRRAHGLVASIIDLAHSQDLRVVAEGVENEETAEELRSLGCDLAQGFHFARPLPAADIAAWIAAHPPHHALHADSTVMHPPSSVPDLAPSPAARPWMY